MSSGNIASASFRKRLKYASAFPRRDAPEVCWNPSPDKGRGRYPKGERGMPGARCTRSRVREV